MSYLIMAETQWNSMKTDQDDVAEVELTFSLLCLMDQGMPSQHLEGNQTSSRLSASPVHPALTTAADKTRTALPNQKT